MFTFKYEHELVKYIYENQEKYFYFKIIYNELYIMEFKTKIDLVGLDKENIYLIEVKSEYISKDDFEELVKIKNNMKMLKNIKGLLIGTKLSKNMKNLINNTKDMDYFIVEDAIYDSNLHRTKKHKKIPCPYSLELLVNVRYNYLVDFDRLMKIRSYREFSVLTFRFNNALGVNLKIKREHYLYYEVILFDGLNEDYYQTVKLYVKISERCFHAIMTILDSFDYFTLTSLESNHEKIKFKELKRRLELAERGMVIYDVYSIINKYIKNFRPLFIMYTKDYDEYALEKEIINTENTYFDRTMYDYLIVVRFVLHDHEFSFIRRKNESNSIGRIIQVLREKKAIMSLKKFKIFVDYLNRKYLIENLYVIINNKIYEALVTMEEKDINRKMILLSFLIETKSNDKIIWKTSIHINEFNDGFLECYILLNNLIKDFTNIIKRHLYEYKTDLKEEYMKEELTEEYNRMVKFFNENKIKI